MKITDQTIPSELNDDYIHALRPSQQWWYVKFGQFKFKQRKFGTGPGVFVARGRGPFRIPHLQGLGPNTPSGSQLLVRAAFKKCVTCFEKQPDSGGVTPPNIGPRNRSWWYNQASPSGLWYFNYFIQKSWLKFYQAIPPDWCRLAGLTHAPVAWGVNGDPDTNYSGDVSGAAITEKDSSYDTIGQKWIYFKRGPTQPKWNTLCICLFSMWATVKVYTVDPNTLDINTVTWNTRPSNGPLLLSFSGILYFGTYWRYWSLKPNQAICVTISASPYGTQNYIGQANCGLLLTGYGDGKTYIPRLSP